MKIQEKRITEYSSLEELEKELEKSLDSLVLTLQRLAAKKLEGYPKLQGRDAESHLPVREARTRANDYLKIIDNINKIFYTDYSQNLDQIQDYFDRIDHPCKNERIYY